MFHANRVTLQDGTSVRLRLPHASDRPAVHALHARLGVEAEDLAIVRAMQFDPRTRTVVCASAWLGTTETLVGYAAADHGADPDLLVVDEASAPGITKLLLGALAAQGAGRSAA